MLNKTELSFQGTELNLNDKNLKFEWKILDAEIIDSILVVCFDYMDFKDSSKNVFGFDFEGEKLWQISMDFDQGNMKNPYTGILRPNVKGLFLYSWAGWRVKVDPSTGIIINKQFTK